MKNVQKEKEKKVSECFVVDEVFGSRANRSERAAKQQTTEKRERDQVGARRENAKKGCKTRV